MDSGVGGLTILNAIRQQMPYLELHYLADDAYAPYGDQPQAILQQRLISIGQYFERLGVAAIVVACNTATVAAIDVLRQHTKLPVIGVEPAVKPACIISKRRRVAVLATPFTARSKRLTDLIDLWKVDAQVAIYASATLAYDIDAWPLQQQAIAETIESLCAEMRAQQIDTLVLACTHYPLVSDLFRAHLDKECEIVEPSQGVVAQLQRRLSAHYGELAVLPDKSSEQGKLFLYSTQSEQSTARFVHWLDNPKGQVDRQWAQLA